MWFVLAVAVALAGDVARGEALARAAGCATCHTAEGGVPYSGGYAVVTKFGTFYGPNLTPDPDYGVGRWTEADFERAMRSGRSPEGRPYYPVFPYTSYTLLRDEDMSDLFAYLRSLAPVPVPAPEHELRRPYRRRWVLEIWRFLGFREGPMADDADGDPVLARGAYLVRAVGHCGECHTPRNALGIVRNNRTFAGTDDPPEPAPDITPDPVTGIGAWTRSELASFLEDGIKPDGDVVGGVMLEIVRDETASLSAADRDAIAAYLRALPVRRATVRRGETVGGAR